MGVLVLMATTATVGAPRAEACSCVRLLVGSHPCLEFRNADTVFAGRPVTVETIEVRRPDNGSAYSQRRFRFEVDEGFRGAEAGDVLKVETGMGGGDCGYDFEPGESYFVYAHRFGDGRLGTGICGGTTALGDAGDDLRYGRRIARGEEPSMLFGVAMHLTRDSYDDYGQHLPIAGATVSVEGADRQTIEATTDSLGRFQVDLPGGGSYTVTADWSTVAPAPATSLPAAAEQVVTVAAGRCAAVELAVDRLARITGTLLDADGQAVEDVYLELLKVATYRRADGVLAAGESSGHDHARVDEYGGFTFERVVPGEYLLVVNHDQSPGTYPRTYYPGTADPAQALTVTVRAGEVADLGVFNLPAPRTTSRIQRPPASE